MQRINNAMSGVDDPVPLDLSRFGEDGGIRVTFRGEDVEEEDEEGKKEGGGAAPPRVVNLNVYETRSRMNFGGFSPSSTSSSFVVYPSSQPQTWFLPFSTFMGSTFTSPDENRRLPLDSLSTKLGLQVSFQEGAFSVALEKIETGTSAACEPPSWTQEKGRIFAGTVVAAGQVASAHLAKARSVLDKSNYGGGDHSSSSCSGWDDMKKTWRQLSKLACLSRPSAVYFIVNSLNARAVLYLLVCDFAFCV